MKLLYSTIHSKRTEKTVATEEVEQTNNRLKTKEMIISGQSSDREIATSFFTLSTV